MSTITFDTLHFANRLKSVGFTDKQAQVLIELQLSVISYEYHTRETNG